MLTDSLLSMVISLPLVLWKFMDGLMMFPLVGNELLSVLIFLLFKVMFTLFRNDMGFLIKFFLSFIQNFIFIIFYLLKALLFMVNIVEGRIILFFNHL